MVAVKDEDGLTKPVAFVVADGVEEQDLIDWALSRLEAYKHPRHVYFVDVLPSDPPGQGRSGRTQANGRLKGRHPASSSSLTTTGPLLSSCSPTLSA